MYPNLLVLKDTSGSVYNMYRQNGYIPLNYLIDHDMQQTVSFWMEGYSSFQSRIENLISDVSLNLTPDAATYQRGTNLGFDIDYKNYSPAPRTCYTITDVELPSSAYYVLLSPSTLSIGGNQSKNVRIDFPVPGGVALGTYRMRTRIGFPGDLWNADFFEFDIIP
jgi:hypothetical protein